MKIVGCDLHTRYQQVAMLDKETGELIERRLEHESGEARAFYYGLAAPCSHQVDGDTVRLESRGKSPPKKSWGRGHHLACISVFHLTTKKSVVYMLSTFPSSLRTQEN